MATLLIAALLISVQSISSLEHAQSVSLLQQSSTVLQKKLSTLHVVTSQDPTQALPQIDDMTSVVSSAAASKSSMRVVASEHGALAQIAVLVLLGITAAVQLTTSGKGLASAVLLSLCCAASFGADHFTIALASDLTKSTCAFMAMKFVVEALISLALHFLWQNLQTGYQEELEAAQKAAWQGQLSAIMSGVLVGVAQVFAIMAFSLENGAQGPLTAVMCSQVFFVAIFFRFYAQEELTWGQLAGVLCIMLGTTFMGLKFGDSGRTNPKALFFAIMALAGYSASCISCRLAGSSGLKARPAVVARLLSVGIPGLVTWTICAVLGQFPYRDSMVFISLPLDEFVSLLPLVILNSLADAQGTYCGQCAFAATKTHTFLLAAIFDMNSVVVLLLQAVVLGTQPSLVKLLSMAMVCAGCCALTLLATQDDTEAAQEPLLADRETHAPSHVLQNLETLSLWLVCGGIVALVAFCIFGNISGGRTPVSDPFGWHCVLMTLAFPCLCVLGRRCYKTSEEKSTQRTQHMWLMILAFIAAVSAYVCIRISDSQYGDFLGYNFTNHEWNELKHAIHSILGSAILCLMVAQAAIGISKKLMYSDQGLKGFTFHGDMGKLIIVLATVEMLLAIAMMEWDWMLKVSLVAMTMASCVFGVL